MTAATAGIFDQFDVFKIPHCRMMQLVNSCNRNMDMTDFTNNDDLFVLLSNLQNIFREFKNHEEIENEFIMRRLNSKLKAMAIHNSAVCNCHKEDEFSPLFDLLESGYLFINKSKSISERINFGVRLRRALKHFEKRFVPHMKEEEEVFQPLLLQYFTPEELAEMKTVVIKLHLNKKKFNTITTIIGRRSDEDSSCQEMAAALSSDAYRLDVSHTDTTSSPISALPNELLVRIFNHMPLADKFRAARVCKKWNQIVYDRFNWKHLKISEWDETTANKIPPSDDNENFLFYQKDEDGDEEIFKNQNEMTSELRTIKFWIKNLLPRVGHYVNKLDLSNCSSLNNNLTRRILQLCPNVSDLDLSFTNIGDNAFRGVSLEKLANLNCEGCERLSDNAFKFILISSTANLAGLLVNNGKRHHKCRQPTSINQTIEHLHGDRCADCTNKQAIEELHVIDIYHGNLDSCGEEEALPEDNCSNPSSNRLQSINLSGCWSITDHGLNLIASKFDLSNLKYLNLSGCVNVTSNGMNMLAEMSRALQGENLYYCDNIVDGPLKNTANGCANVDCSTKYCCRSYNVC